MLNRFRDIVCDELVAQLLEARRERAQPIDLLPLERQVSPQEVVVSSRQRRDAQVWDAVREMVERVRNLAALELGVAGQRDERPLVLRLDPADRLDVIADPRLGANEVHASTMR